MRYTLGLTRPPARPDSEYFPASWRGTVTVGRKHLSAFSNCPCAVFLFGLIGLRCLVTTAFGQSQISLKRCNFRPTPTVRYKPSAAHLCNTSACVVKYSHSHRLQAGAANSWPPLGKSRTVWFSEPSFVSEMPPNSQLRFFGRMSRRLVAPALRLRRRGYS